MCDDLNTAYITLNTNQSIILNLCGCFSDTDAGFYVRGGAQFVAEESMAP